MPARTIPWNEIRDAQLAKAEYQLQHQPIEPDADAGGWWVSSSTGDGQQYLVTPKVKRGDGPTNPGKRNGQWWHVLVCTCRAAQTGYMLCWHKAAVFLYWKACIEAKRMEGIGSYLMSDGPAPEPDGAITEVESTPEVETVVGPPTRRRAKAGTPKTAGKPGASGGRKKRQTSH